MKTSILSLILMVAVWSAGCDSDQQTTSTSDNHIIGVTKLLEMNCSASAISSGISVEVVGTNFKATTDTAGTWQIDNLPAGVYTIRFSKPGFTHFVTSNVSFPGGTMYWLATQSPVAISRLANFVTKLDTAVTQKSVYQGDTNYSIQFPMYAVRDSTGASLGQHTVYLFIGRHASVNYQDTTSYFLSNYGAAPLAFYLTTRNNNVHKGDTIYVIGYPFQCSAGRIDYTIGNNYAHEWAGFGAPSQVKQIILP